MRKLLNNFLGSLIFYVAVDQRSRGCNRCRNKSKFCKKPHFNFDISDAELSTHLFELFDDHRCIVDVRSAWLGLKPKRESDNLFLDLLENVKVDLVAIRKSMRSQADFVCEYYGSVNEFVYTIPVDYSAVDMFDASCVRFL